MENSNDCLVGTLFSYTHPTTNGYYFLVDKLVAIFADILYNTYIYLKYYINVSRYRIVNRGFTLDDAPMFPPEWKDEYGCDDYIEWPKDITSDGDYKAALCSYKAFYYDHLGRAYEIIEYDK